MAPSNSEFRAIYPGARVRSPHGATLLFGGALYVAPHNRAKNT
jgi:hypothetical protein